MYLIQRRLPMWFPSGCSINNSYTIFHYHSSRDDMILWFYPTPRWILWEISLISGRSKHESMTIASHWDRPSKRVLRGSGAWLSLQGCLVLCATLVTAGGQRPSYGDGRVLAPTQQCFCWHQRGQWPWAPACSVWVQTAEMCIDGE